MRPLYEPHAPRETRPPRGHCYGWECAPDWTRENPKPDTADDCPCDCEKCENPEEPLEE